MLITKLAISQKLAKHLATITEEDAIKKAFNIAIAIVDDAGQLIHFTKMDGSSNVSGDHAIAKAKHAVNFRRDTKFHEDLLAAGNLRVLALPGSFPVEGGMQLIHEGNLIGAIGVSGAPSAEDGRMAGVGAGALTALKEEAVRTV